MASGISAHGVTLENIFDPYRAGTTQAANSNINGGGSELSTQFANILYGTAAAATGITVKIGPSQVDLNTLYAAKGTASYTLPIQGQTFAQNTLVASHSSGRAQLTFSCFSGNWSVDGSGTGTLHPAAGNFANGPIPAGAVNVQYGATFVSDTGSPASTSSNGAPTPTAVSSNPQVFISTGGTGTQPGNVGTYNMQVTFFNSGGTSISNTTFQFQVSYDGSA